MAEVDQIAAQLYADPPERFVPARDEAVAAAKAAGDHAAARAIAALKKPTVAAWLVNLLALRRPDLIDELVELAGALGQAQRQLRGEQLRELSVRRRTLVGSLVQQARDLAAEAGAAAGKLPLGEIESTLNAALADQAVAEQVRSGRLLKTTSYAGFGAMPAASDSPPVARPVTPSAGAAGPLVQLRSGLDAAREAGARARAALDDATEAEQQAGRELADLEKALTELRRRRDDAREELSSSRLARIAARRSLDAAARQVEQAEAVLDARSSGSAEA